MKLRNRRLVGILAAAAMTTTVCAGTVSAASGMNVTGSIGGSEAETTVNAVLAIDEEAGTFGINGALSVAGSNLDFSQFMDSEKIVVSVPMLGMGISYNYRTVPTGALAQMLPVEGLKAINDYIELLYDNTFVPADTDVVAQNLTANLTNALSGVQPSPLDAKDCLVGDSTVSCTGFRVDLTGEDLAKVYDAFLTTEIKEGDTFGDRLAMLAEMYGGFAVLTDDDQLSQSAELINVALNAHDMIASFPGAQVDVYMTEAYPAELDVTIDGQTFGLLVAGDPATPWSTLIAVADGQELGRLETSINEAGGSAVLYYAGAELAALDVKMNGADGTVSFSANGELIATVNYSIVEDGFSADLDVSGETQATFTLSGNKWTLDIPSLGLPLGGEVIENGFTAKVEGLADLTFTFGEVDAPVVPEGEMLDLGTAAEDELAGLFSIIGAMIPSTAGEAEVAPAA